MKNRKALDQDGLLHVPMMLVLLVAVTASLGTWMIMHHWRKITELQLRLDRCVGKAAHDLRSTQQKIENMNAEILALRTSIMASAELPPVVAALKVSLSALALDQKITLEYWNARAALWMTGIAGCRQFGDWATPLPELPWETLPPDSIGPEPLHWPHGTPKSYFIAIQHAPRAAVAQVFSSSQKGKIAHALSHKDDWQVRWSNLSELAHSELSRPNTH